MPDEDGTASDLIAGLTIENKVEVLPGGTVSAATYCINEEDHTLGNALRWMIMKNPNVEFCGYSAPHPSEAKIHLRIQMYDDLPALDALHEALNNLEDLTLHISESYNTAIADTSSYAHVEDEAFDFETVNAKLWADKEARGEGTRDEFEAKKREEKEREEKEKEKDKKGGKKVAGKPIKPQPR